MPPTAKKSKISPTDFANLYDGFNASVSRFDCGRKCAPLNDGEPVCCSTQNAVPVVHKVEWELLKTRTDLWSKFKPYDYSTRMIVEELTSDCMAIHCKGARHCERDNRSLSCRAFPFFPYLTREDAFVGLACFWGFEDRCWVQSNLQIVDRRYVRQFVAAYELLFAFDPEERRANWEESVSARAVFARWNRPMPLIGRDGEFLLVEPRTHRIRPSHWREYKRHENFAKQARAEAARR